MWSLPNITNLNSTASLDSTKQHIKDQMDDPSSVECDICGEPSEMVQEWYDIFSDDAKGVAGMCNKHYQDYGMEGESYFTCETCERMFVKNYTWENYFKYSDEEGMQCINCARKKYLADEDNWIDPDTEITFDMVRKAPHLIAHGQRTPLNLEYLGNGEFDNMTGEGIYGNDAMGKLNAARSKADGRPVILVMDGAYQFAVSIGLYARKAA